MDDHPTGPGERPRPRPPIPAAPEPSVTGDGGPDERPSRKIGRRASYREGMTFSALTFGSLTFMALLSSVLNSRMYGIVVIGQYALAMATVAIVRLLSTAKERPALIRELTLLEPRHPRVTGLFIAILVFSGVLTVLVALIALVVTHVLFTGPISEPGVFLPTAVNVFGYALIGNTSDNFDVIFQGYRASRQTFWAQLFTATSFVVISVVLGITDPTVWGLIIAQVGSQVTGLFQRLFMVRRFMRFSASRAVVRDGFRTLPGLIRFGLKITPGALADGGSQASGTWIVASFNRIATVGAYGRAATLINQLTTLNMHTNLMLFPTLVERRAKNDGPGYARALVDTLRYTSVSLLLPAAAGGGVAAGVMRIFGPGFERGADALAILLFVPPLVALTQIQRNALYSLDLPGLGSISGILRLIATLVVGILLTWQIGVDGAALGMVFGLLVDLAFSSRIVRRHLTTPFRTLWPLHQRLAVAVACAGGFAASRLIYTAVGYPLGIFAGAAAGTAVLLVVLLLGGAVNERDRDRLNEVRRMIAQRRLQARLARSA